METLPTAEVHLDHCVDIIRQSLQCITPLTWRARSGGSLRVDVWAEHRCVDSDRLHAWARERLVWDDDEVFLNRSIQS
jgi:hypothetical protein